MTAIKSALEDFRTVIGLVRPLIPEWEPAAMLAGIDAAEAEVRAMDADAPLDAGATVDSAGADVLAILDAMPMLPGEVAVTEVPVMAGLPDFLL